MIFDSCPSPTNIVEFKDCLFRNKSQFMSFFITESMIGAGIIILSYSLALIYLCYKRAEFNILVKILTMVLIANLLVIFYSVFLILLEGKC
jgi:hypothetical protein